MSYFPTFTASPAIDMMEMGITHDMYVKLQKVAADNHCVIMIRKTNKGSVMPFANRTAVGKKLATKGKSSDAFFTKGNITFLAQMAKKLAPESWFKEQCDLIGLLGENSSEGNRTSANKTDGAFIPKYRFIPKLLTIEMVNNLLNEVHTSDEQIIDLELPEDLISGRRETTLYKLVRTTWNEVNSLFQNELAPPAKNIKGQTPLYRVFIWTINGEFPFIRSLPQHSVTIPVSAVNSTIRSDLFIPVPAQTEAGSIRPRRAPSHQTGAIATKRITPNGDAYEVPLPKILELRLWEHKTYTNDGNGQAAITAAIDNNFQECAPALEGFPNYREVRVLALRTRGVGLDDRSIASQVAKRYYEVVADYDIFMVAPKISELSIVQKDGDVFMKIGSDNFSVLPKLGNEVSIKPRAQDDNPYGLLSPYEFQVRREINRALGIKVAQHGAEIANLFYTSDIKDPVIAIYPFEQNIPIAPIESITPSVEIEQGRWLASSFNPELTNWEAVKSGPCFIMSMEMLFEMINLNIGTDYIERILNNDELNNTYGLSSGTSINYRADRYNFTEDFGIIMNLNWGTEAYYKFNIKSGYKFGSESLDVDYDKLEDEAVKTAVKINYEASIRNIFNLYIDKKDNHSDFSRIDALFSGFDSSQNPFNFAASRLPISLRILIFFLYRKYTRYNSNLHWLKILPGQKKIIFKKAVDSNKFKSEQLFTRFRNTLSYYKKLYKSILENGIPDSKTEADCKKYDELRETYQNAIRAIDIIINRVVEDRRRTVDNTIPAQPAPDRPPTSIAQRERVLRYPASGRRMTQSAAVKVRRVPPVVPRVVEE